MAHIYNQDTNPGDYNPIQILIKSTDQIKEWMSQKSLQLHKGKTEIIVFGEIKD